MFQPYFRSQSLKLIRINCLTSCEIWN